MTVLTNIVFLASTILFTRSVFNLVFIIQSLRWLGSVNFKKGYKEKELKTYIIIPVLREQKKIIPTLEYFLEYFTGSFQKIFIVSSEKEFEKNFSGKPTQEIVKSFIEDKKLGNYIELINYPKTVGYTPHQLNYALSEIKNDESFVAIYNADSRPHKKTFEIFNYLVQKNVRAEVFQQSSIFVKNLGDIEKRNNKINGIFLKVNALLQSRWTFAHEIPRILRQSNNNFFSRFINAHVVSHGLFIKTKLIKDFGGFPQDNITEDLFLGYLLKIRRKSIYSIPLLEIADSPTTIKSAWHQKYVWFWGPMKYFSYFTYAKELLKENFNFLLAFSISIQGIFSALAWLLSGPIVFICLVSPLISKNIFLVFFSYFSVLLYGPIQYLICFSQIRKYSKDFNKKCLGKITIGELLIMVVISIPVILFHSIPPYKSVFVEISNKIFHKPIKRYKIGDYE